MRVINAATESLPKLFLFGLIIAQTGADSTASISSYVSLGFVLVNIVASLRTRVDIQMFFPV